jgi:hypothetical protein
LKALGARLGAESPDLAARLNSSDRYVDDQPEVETFHLLLLDMTLSCSVKNMKRAKAEKVRQDISPFIVGMFGKGSIVIDSQPL